jgi:hypothetical protein
MRMRLLLLAAVVATTAALAATMGAARAHAAGGAFVEPGIPCGYFSLSDGGFGITVDALDVATPSPNRIAVEWCRASDAGSPSRATQIPQICISDLTGQLTSHVTEVITPSGEMVLVCHFRG